MRSIVLNCLKQIATLVSGLGKKKLFILIYHRVLDEPDFMRPDEVDKNIFDWQMELLSNFFNVLSLEDGLEKLRNGELPSRAVCITFDDGYADNYLNALPILKKYQLTATFFIASGFLNGGRMWNDTIIETLRNYKHPKLDLTAMDLGVYNSSSTIEKMHAATQIIQKIKHLPMQQRAEYTKQIATNVESLPDDLMMTNNQLIQLKQNGMEVGGHTVTHPIMAKITKDQLQIEITKNIKTLETLLNTDIKFFAYPNGRPEQDYLPEQVQLIKDYGFQAAVSTQWGVASQQSDLFQLPRFTPWDATPLKFMIRMIYMFSKTG